MRIVVKERGSKEYYDEFLYIVYFGKRFIKNPNNKVHRMTRYLIGYILVMVMLFILELFLYSKTKDGLAIFAVGFLTLLLFYLVVNLRVMNNRIKMFREKEGDIIFSMDDKGIMYESENMDVKLKWQDLKAVVIGKYSITFIPDSINNSFTSVSMVYKDEVMKSLKKYNKLDLIVKNKG